MSGHSKHIEDKQIHTPNKRNIVISIVLNFAITVAEFIGGILSNSLALLSDALHNLSDTFAIFISYIAMIVGEKGSTRKNTFGYKRIEILAALLNAIILIVISFYLFYEAYQRFLEPEPVKGNTMLVVAVIGLIANLISVLLLHRDSRSSLNIKAAFIHLIGDTLSSVGVIIASLLIYFYGLYWVDPLLTFIIGIFILRGTYGILKETIEILMQATPGEIDIRQIKNQLEQDDRVENIHHIHIWRLSDNQVHFECHADLSHNYTMQQADALRKELEKLLNERFQINHITIQMEYHACDDKSPIVSPTQSNSSDDSPKNDL
ncbi:MAG: cation transporter [Bacteroidales bacterium]|nr:cation transporter [Bacteroidales bacterium]